MSKMVLQMPRGKGVLRVGDEVQIRGFVVSGDSSAIVLRNDAGEEIRFHPTVVAHGVVIRHAPPVAGETVKCKVEHAQRRGKVLHVDGDWAFVRWRALAAPESIRLDALVVVDDGDDVDARA